MAVHWLRDGHATESIPAPAVLSTTTGAGAPGEVGLNLTSRPAESTAVQRLVDGQATALRAVPGPLELSICTGVGEPGEAGLNVTSSPAKSTAVHWLVDGHATDTRKVGATTAALIGAPGEPGVNVTSRPKPSTAVHWLLDGHATSIISLVPSTVVAVGVPGDVRVNVIVATEGVDGGALAGRRTCHRLRRGERFERHWSRRSRRGRIERDLMQAVVDCGALAGRRARDGDERRVWVALDRDWRGGPRRRRVESHLPPLAADGRALRAGRDGPPPPVRRAVGAGIRVGVGWSGEPGLNVTCCPSRSIAVHWLVDGHATALRFPG